MTDDRPPGDPHATRRRPPPDDEPARRLAAPGGAVALEMLLQRGQPLAHERVVSILRDVAHAVDLLARAGRVYGAISPATITVDPQGRARLVPPEDAEVLRPAYLAPEQRAGARTGPALDQYALAVVARELLHDVDIGTWDVARRALATDPGARFPSASAFVEALAAQLDLPPVAPSPDDDVAVRAVAARLARAARPAGAARERPQRRLRGTVYEVVTIGGIALAIVALARGGRPFAWLWRWRGEPAPVVASPSAAAPADAPSGFVRVRVDGGHPTILLDGLAVDTAPAVLSVRPGVHRVALRAAGRAYAPSVVTVRVAAGDTARVAFTRP